MVTLRNPMRFIKILLISWCVLSFAALLNFIFTATHNSSAGEVAFLMAMLSFPSSILTGILMNLVEFGAFLPESPAAAVFLTWLPFFLFGAIQWAAVGFLWDVFLKNNNKSQSSF